ncbi:hypothetical protein Taro_052212 [Colocasia esculenta]|uniref:Uncharacterized protein n=1 Tax=Colocasia esculenta TaxID=4460 RepID=A0A843XIZ5_COLES|nr:hypothetical protein [Colocasia esculenta]
MTCYIFIYLNRDMVRGGRSQTVFKSVGRGSASPSTTGTTSPSTPVIPVTNLTYIQFCRDCLPVHAGHPGDRDRLPIDHVSSATFPFFLTTRWRASIQQRMRRGLSYRDSSHVGSQDPDFASRYITTLVHAHIPGPVDAWREIPVPVRDLLFDMFTDPPPAPDDHEAGTSI